MKELKERKVYILSWNLLGWIFGRKKLKRGEKGVILIVSLIKVKSERMKSCDLDVLYILIQDYDIMMK